MKKLLLSLGVMALAIGANAQKTAADICGTYNVDAFGGYQYYWFTSGADWETFNYSDYEVKINPVQGNIVALSGIPNEGINLYGEYDADTSTITFRPQGLVYDGYKYLFCKEVWNSGNNGILPDQDVVANVSEDGKITFNDWELVYFYDNGGQWTPFSYITVSLTKVSDEVETSETVSAAEICGTYNVKSFSGYDYYWFSDATTWNEFAWSDYEVTLDHVGGNIVALTGLLDESMSFYGVYDKDVNTITFVPQGIEYDGYRYVFCQEKWAVDSAGETINYVVPDTSVVASINEEGNIDFSGWDLEYFYENGAEWTPFSWIACTLEKVGSGVSNIALDNETPAEYFNLQGVRVNTPANGLYIVKRGNKAEKILVK